MKAKILKKLQRHLKIKLAKKLLISEGYQITKNKYWTQTTT